MKRPCVFLVKCDAFRSCEHYPAIEKNKFTVQFLTDKNTLMSSLFDVNYYVVSISRHAVSEKMQLLMLYLPIQHRIQLPYEQGFMDLPFQPVC